MKLWIKIGEWAKGLAMWAKALTGIIMFVSMVVGGYHLMKGGIIKNYEEDKKEQQDSTDLQQVKVGLDTVAHSVRILAEEFNSFREWEETRAQETEDKMNYLIQSDKNLQDFLLRYADDVNEVLEIMDIWDIKKNSVTEEEKIVSGR